jgi:hypothetical protein
MSGGNENEAEKTTKKAVWKASYCTIGSYLALRARGTSMAAAL